MKRTILAILFFWTIPIKGADRMNQFKNKKTEIQKSFNESDVYFENTTAGITLAGTLTLPNTHAKSPVVLLIAGMGPMDRDATFLHHKRHAVIATFLAEHGIASLRVDKRGVGKSTGTFSTNLTSRDFADDAIAAISFLKTRTEINPAQIGLIGHSEGGLIAVMVAAECPDIAFVILMSGSVITTVDGQVLTTARQLHFDGASEKLIKADSEIRKKVLNTVVEEKVPEAAVQKMDALICQYWNNLAQELKQEAEKIAFAITLSKKDGLIAAFNSPWFRFFFNFDVTEDLKHIKAPLLALNGDLDFNAPDLAFPIISKALQEAGNTNFITMVMPKLNHNMQTCITGSIPEYSVIEETIAQDVLDRTTQFIKNHTYIAELGISHTPIDYAQLKIKSYQYWDLYLHENQCYLGRTFLQLKNETGVEDFLAIAPDAQREFFAVGNQLKTALKKLFMPDKMNYAALSNSSPVVHVHLIPRYKESRTFNGMTFTDTRWGKNYAPYDKEFALDVEMLIKIKNILKEELL